MYGESVDDLKKWKEALIANGAKWEDGYARRVTIHHDGTVESHWGNIINKTTIFSKFLRIFK